MPKLPNYVVITPARNEGQFIELTIRSVIAQKSRPMKWVIVSDGSTDSTDDIVSGYAAKYPWIELQRMPVRNERHFAGKVQAFNVGHDAVRELGYEVIVSLDGDISFDDQYFSFLLQKLAEDPALGVVGTPFREGPSMAYDYRFVNIEHVSGACQVFRRKCFEDIGGYVAVKGGSIDHIAVLSARMRGWKTRTFTDRICQHHRQMGTAQHSLAKARFKGGAKDYAMGNHPLWEAFRTAYQMTKKPFVVGGLMIASGYVWSLVRRAERPVSSELVAFQRREQMARLKRFFRFDKLRQRQTLAASS